MPLDTETSWYTNAIGFSFNHVYINNFSKDLSLRLTDCFIFLLAFLYSITIHAKLMLLAQQKWYEVKYRRKMPVLCTNTHNDAIYADEAR